MSMSDDGMFPNQGYPEQPQPAPQAHLTMGGSVLMTFPEDVQQEIIDQCNLWKKGITANAQEKKMIQERCYAYFHNRFVGDDLLPLPEAIGSENDANSSRPQVFIPVVRQQAKILYSGLKMTLMPNDEDYFRVRAKTAEGVDAEDTLNEGFKYEIKRKRIQKKLADFCLNLVIFGQAVAYPKIVQHQDWQWTQNAKTGQHEPELILGTPEIDLEIWNPIYFYADPTDNDNERARWGYFTNKKRSDIMADPNYQNKENLPEGSKIAYDAQMGAANIRGLSQYNGLNKTLADIEPHLRVDYYYFPYIRLERMGNRELRNMLFAVAEESVLIDGRPNLTRGGLSPVVFEDWMTDNDSGCGTGPCEDQVGIQRTVNIIWNYLIETFARIGNRYIVREGVDLTQFWGIAGGVATAKTPREDMIAITGDYVETSHLLDLLGLMKAEAQQVAGAQNPFQGSSDIDTKKTATEINLLHQNGATIGAEVADNVSHAFERIFDRLMMLMGEHYTEPMPLKVNNNQGQPESQSADFTQFLSGQFNVEMVSTNAAQSKQAQIAAYNQLLQLISSNPGALITAAPLLKKMGALWGLKDTDELLAELQQSNQMFQQFEGFMQHEQAIQAQQQGVSGPQGGGGAPPQ